MKKAKLFFFFCMGIMLLYMIPNTGLAQVHSDNINSASIRIQYLLAGHPSSQITELPKYNENISGNIKLTTYQNKIYQVMIQEIDRGNYVEINGSLEYMDSGTSALTLR